MDIGLKTTSFLFCLGLTVMFSGTADAGVQDRILQRLNDLSATVESQQETLKKQAAEIKRLQQALNQQVEKTPKYEAGEGSGRDKAKSPLAALEGLLGDRFKFGTDFRLRYEGLYHRKFGNIQADDRHRWRIRWRIFSDYRVSDELWLRSMLTTSSGGWFDSGKGSRNWTPGRTSNATMEDEFDNKGIYIGRIYAAYTPKWLPGLEAAGGKFANPFMRTDIMWDPDVNPEGFYQRYTYQGGEIFEPFLRFGQMMVSENSLTEDAHLFIWQGGAKLKLPGGFNWILAGSYYDWQNFNHSQMSRVENNSAGNSVDSGGNYIFDYKLAEAITFLNFTVSGLPVKLWFDYVKNTAPGLPSDRDTAFSTGLMLGQAKKTGDWALYFKYAQIEPDALVGAVSDGDFYGANRIGYKAQLRYMIINPIQFRLSWFQTDSMEGPEQSENRLQTDLIFKFNL